MSKQSVRKKMSISKLTIARIEYISKYHFHFISHQMKSRTDIVNMDFISKDTQIIEAGIKLLFEAICGVESIAPEQADKIAIEEYSNNRTNAYTDDYLDKLKYHVQLSYDKEKQDAITPKDRMKAVQERKVKTTELSDEWGE